MVWKVLLSIMAMMIAPTAAAQTWRVYSEDDPFDDRPNIRAAVSGRDYMMAVRCKAGLLEVIFMGGYIGESDANVRYRFDDGEIHDDVWDSSTSQEGLFADAPGEVARWLSQAGRVAFEYEDFAGTPHQYRIPLSGSGASIGRVMDACQVPRADPRSQDDAIWRRAVIDLDKVEISTVAAVQNFFTRGDWGVQATGVRDIATYRALSDFYVAYWSLCEDGQPLSSSCSTWLSTRRYDPDADYPKEPLALLVEVVQEDRPEDSE